MIKPRYQDCVLFFPGKMYERMSKIPMTKVAMPTLELAMSLVEQQLALSLTQLRRIRKPRWACLGKYHLSTTKKSRSEKMKKTRMKRR
jgi:hypothetical protein